MAFRVTVHVLNEEAFVADMEAMPDPAGTYLHLSNPRSREGKPVTWPSRGATSFLFPWSRITYVELMVRDEDLAEVEKFYKEAEGLL